MIISARIFNSKDSLTCLMLTKANFLLSRRTKALFHVIDKGASVYKARYFAGRLGDLVTLEQWGLCDTLHSFETLDGVSGVPIR